MVLPTQLMEIKTRQTFLRYRVTTTSYSCQRRNQRAPRWKRMLLISWAVHQHCPLAFSWCGESSAVGFLFVHYFCPQPQEMLQIFNDIFLKGRFFKDYTHKCLLHYFIKQVTGTSLMKISFLLKNWIVSQLCVEVDICIRDLSMQHGTPWMIINTNMSHSKIVCFF